MKKHTDSPAAAFPETITFRSSCARPKSGVSLLNLFLTLLGYGGILWAMMTLYTPDCRKTYFLPAAGVLFLVAAGIQLLPRFSGKLTLGYLGLLLAFAFWKARRIVEGIQYIVNLVYQKAHNTDVVYFTIHTKNDLSGSVLLTCICIAGLLAVFLAFFTMRKPHFVLTASVTFLLIEPGLYFGLPVSVFAMALLLAYWCGMLAMRSGDYEIVALLTTVDGSTRRSTMHGIPAALLQAQAERIGIPLYRLDLAPNGDMADYGAAMSRAVAHFGARGVTHFIFGDIFLHDVRAYRERQLAPFGIEVVEPLWGESSQEVMADFLASGLKTVVVTTMDDGLGRAAVGRVVDRDFVASLPAGTDPNGENGEYHTFCYDGPIFASPVPFRLGTPFSRSYDVRLDDGTSKSYAYWFADLREA